MLQRTLPLLALPLVAAGCGLELLGATAIQSGLQAENAKTLKGTLDYVQGTTDRLGFDQAVSAYRAEKGSNPPSVDAMIREGYLASAPLQPDGSPYGYDPATGQLIEGAMASAAPEAPAAAAITPEDREALQKLKAAVLDYWTSKKVYPSSLYALAPEFLDSIPATSSGQAFVYDPQTARVYHPAELAPQPGAMHTPQTGSGAQRPAAGYGGPMGEAMTGIGIQQELNGMGSAGAAAAGSRARGNVGGVGLGHDAQQQQVMDNLGL